MQWNASPNAGFCPDGVEPWLPIGDDYTSMNVESELDDPGSLLSLTRELIRLRQSTPALRDGSYAPVDDVPEDCFVYWREGADGRFLVALNFSAKETTIKLVNGGRSESRISTDIRRSGTVQLDSLVLGANEGLVVEIQE